MMVNLSTMDFNYGMSTALNSNMDFNYRMTTALDGMFNHMHNTMNNTFDEISAKTEQLNKEITALINDIESNPNLKYAIRAAINNQKQINAMAQSESTKKIKVKEETVYFNKATYYHEYDGSKQINHEDYSKFYVNDNSLDLFNIVDGDILFVKTVTPGGIASNIKQGSICVYKKLDDSEYPRIYKTWTTINLNVTPNWKTYPNRIMQKTDYRKIENDIRHASRNYATDHFYKINIVDRFIKDKIYNVAIVTRLDIDGCWIFDMIPAKDIIGVVEYAIPADKVELLK